MWEGAAKTAAPGLEIVLYLGKMTLYAPYRGGQCAGSFPGPDSPASCYLLEADGFRLVIDLGNGSLGALQKYAALSGIDAVCLSHLHIDHCVDPSSYSIARAFHPDGQL